MKISEEIKDLIIITNLNEVEYNRTAIMKEGWKLKKDGIGQGISIAWKMARTAKEQAEKDIKAEYERQQEEEALLEYEEELSPEYYWEEDMLMKMEREKAMLEHLSSLDLEELYQMAKDVKGMNIELKINIAKVIIAKKRKVA